MEALALSEAGIAAWLTVFARVAGWAMLDPLLARLPLFLRLMVAAVLAAALLPGVNPAPIVSPFSLAGAVALSVQWSLGALLAMVVRLIFAASQAMLAWFSQTATGGLLALTEEHARYTEPGLRQLAWWLAVLAFLAANGHLLVVNALMQGIAHASVVPSSAVGVRELIDAAGWIFATGIQLALPLLVFALLLHLSLAIIARTQSGVDMFSTGLAMGALAVLFGLTWAVPLITVGIQQGLVHMQPWLTSLGR